MKRIALAAGSLSVILAAGASAQTATATPTVTAAMTATTTCPLVSTFMKAGAPNDVADVSRLQLFLKEAQGADVDVTGIFDEKTEAAVKAFQRANMADIMGPWGATQPSGVVYLTTLKKINQIACASPLSLDQSELSVIGAYRAAADDRDASMGSGTSAVATVTGAAATTAAAPSGSILVPASPDSAAAAIGADIAVQREPYDLDTVDERPILTRLMAYLRGLFGR